MKTENLSEQTLFENEVEKIQKRHSLFFPMEQRQFIQVSKENGRHSLHFAQDYNLPDVITLEVQFAFKLIF